MDIVYESDDLEGAADGLGAGYGQSKWVSEKLIMKAQELGLPATIIRPGYIVGESRSGVTNSDDFLWRLMKGCIELGCSPRLGTRLNMCPVDYVAGASVAIAMNTQSLGSVHHMYNPHAFGFDDFFEQVFFCIGLLTHAYLSSRLFPIYCPAGQMVGLENCQLEDCHKG